MHNQNIKKLIILMVVLVVLVVIVAAFLTIFSDGKKTKKVDLISLGVSSDKPSYASSDEIKLTVSLTNAGDSNACLSNTALGNIKFLSVTRDGNPVETRNAPSYFLTSLSEIIKSKLRPLAPGEKIEIALSSSEDPGLGARALSTVATEGTAGMATFYNIKLPGTYKIDVAYEYPGEPSADCSDIFKGATNVATVSFIITE